MAFLVLAHFGFNREALFAEAVEVHPQHGKIMAPGFQPVATRSRRSRSGSP